jgi:hypothetical protein
MRFQADGKQQKDGADSGNGVNGVRGDDQARAVRTKKHASKDLTQHCGKAHPLKGFAKEFGPHEDKKQLKEKWISGMHGT